jgi:extradiol dioxygenase family protein
VTQVPFHTSIAVSDIAETKNFYVYVLGCTVGRSAHNWVDIDFFGHQLTAQLEPSMVVPHDEGRRAKRKFPVRHFGVIIPTERWCSLLDNLMARNVDWIVEPPVFFSGEAGERRCMILRDPDGCAIEFKSFSHTSNIFKKSLGTNTSSQLNNEANQTHSTQEFRGCRSLLSKCFEYLHSSNLTLLLTAGKAVSHWVFLAMKPAVEGADLNRELSFRPKYFHLAMADY